MTVNDDRMRDEVQAILQYYPGGDAMRAGYDEQSLSNMLARGFARTFMDVDIAIARFRDQIHPDTTVDYLAEWERAVGIPDDCFTNTGTNAQRLLNIHTKLFSLGAQTKDDWEAVALLFGVDVDVNPGLTHSDIVNPLVNSPLIVFPSALIARNTIVVLFDVSELVDPIELFTYEFDAAPDPPLGFRFGNQEIGTVVCLFEQMKPANCNLMLREV
jgi:uncharacterized protein YmfQ (DUF2313 family)